MAVRGMSWRAGEKLVPSFVRSLAAAETEAMREAVRDTELGCLQGVFLAPLASSAVDAERVTRKWKTGVGMRMV